MRVMPTRILVFAFTTAAVMAMVPFAYPQDADRGQIEFLLNCASCHGTDAKGSGTESAKLHLKPVDLTVLAKRNHGRFDPLPATTKRKQKIPKRILSQMKPHEDELDSLLDLPCDSEAAIRERLLALVSYLSLVQEK
jgi:hypothetical protein